MPVSPAPLTSVLEICLLAGRIMAENGANTARVEAAVEGIGRALGAEQVEVTFIPPTIVASFVAGSERRTLIRRVGATGVQLGRLGQVLELEREAEGSGLTSDVVEARLRVIEHSPGPYGPFLATLAVGLGCAASAVKFGGSLRIFGVVLVTAALAQGLRLGLTKTRLGGFLGSTVVAAFASTVAILLTNAVGAPDSSGVSIAAALLLLNPGVPMLSGAADLMRGDTVAGLARLAASLTRVFAIAIGVWVVSLALNLHVERLTYPGQQNILLASLAAALSALGFGTLFGVAPRNLAPGASVGLLAALVQATAATHGAPAPLAALLAGFTVGITAASWSHWLRVPYPTFGVPGYVPLIPGALFIHGVLGFVAGDYVNGSTSLIQALLVLLAIVVGMISVPTLFGMHQKGLA